MCLWGGGKGGGGDVGRSDSVAPAMADPRPLYSLDHQRRGRDGDIGSVTWHIASHAGKRRRQMVEGIIWDSHLSRECGAPGAGRAVGLGIYFPSRCVPAPCLAPWIEDRLLWRVLSLGCFGLIPILPILPIRCHRCSRRGPRGWTRPPSRPPLLFACMAQSSRSLLAASARIYPCY